MDVLILEGFINMYIYIIYIHEVSSISREFQVYEYTLNLFTEVELVTKL